MIPIFGIPSCAVPFNAPAARTYLPITLKKTELVLAGRSKAQMFEAIKIAFDKKELSSLESGAMCYMLSRQSYLSDRGGHWHPHLMFFVPLTDPAAWGANLPGSPIFGSQSIEDRLTIFLVPSPSGPTTPPIPPTITDGDHSWAK
jgi:hypothetical protein